MDYVKLRCMCSVWTTVKRLTFLRLLIFVMKTINHLCFSLCVLPAVTRFEQMYFKIKFTFHWINFISPVYNFRTGDMKLIQWNVNFIFKYICLCKMFYFISVIFFLRETCPLRFPDTRRLRTTTYYVRPILLDRFRFCYTRILLRICQTSTWRPRAKQQKWNLVLSKQ